MAPPQPLVDRSAGTWRASVPGIGSVLVYPDGSFDVSDEHSDPAAHSALTHGWGELLGCARRGHALALGAALVPRGGAPAGEHALLVTGDPQDVGAAVLALAAADWLVLSDRPAPTSWDDAGLVAHPRPAPVLVPRQRAAAAGVGYAEVHPGSTAVAVDMPRSNEPAPVAALVHVQRRRPHEDAFDVLTGQRRFERAANLLLGGVLAPVASPSSSRTPSDEHIALAHVPSAVLRIGPDACDVTPLLEWYAR